MYAKPRAESTSCAICSPLTHVPTAASVLSEKIGRVFDSCRSSPSLRACPHNRSRTAAADGFPRTAPAAATWDATVRE